MRAIVLTAVAGAVTLFLLRRYTPSLPPVLSRYTYEHIAATIGLLAAGLLWGGWTGVVWLLNRRRARVFKPPGSCPHCGSDRAGLAPIAGSPCPECGSKAPPVP